MPVILADPDDWLTWLNPEVSQQDVLGGALSIERMSLRPLPSAFNDACNKTPDILFA
jgi:hypothetical protein